MSSDKILIEDVRFYAHHGVTPAEQEVGTWFGVDVELGFDLASAAASDDLAATVDYGLVAARIVEVGTPEHFFTDPQEERTKLFLSQIL